MILKIKIKVEYKICIKKIIIKINISIIQFSLIKKCQVIM